MEETQKFPLLPAQNLWAIDHTEQDSQDTVHSRSNAQFNTQAARIAGGVTNSYPDDELDDWLTELDFYIWCVWKFQN